MPSERSHRSASVVPTVVVVMIAAQNSSGLKRLVRICAASMTASSAAKIAVPAR